MSEVQDRLAKLPSDVLVAGEQVFAVGLHWQSLIGRGSERSRLTNNADMVRKRYAVSVHDCVRHAPISQGMIDEGDSWGFYKGRLPDKIEGVKGRPKIYALASIVARTADPQSLFVLGMTSQHYSVIAVKNGHPVLDLLCNQEEVLAVAEWWRQNEAVSGATLYLTGRYPDELEQELNRHYANLQDAPADIYTADAQAELKPVPGRLAKLAAVTAAIALAVFLIWQWLPAGDEQAPRQAPIIPDKLYALSRDQTLAATGMTPAPRFMAALRQHELWRKAPVAGWRVKGLKCIFSEGVRCERQWERLFGRNQNLAVLANVTPQSLTAAMDYAVLSIAPLQLDIAALPEEQETLLRWGSWFQHLKDASDLGGEDARTTLRLDPPLLVGQWPAGMANQNSSEIVKGGAWVLAGDLALASRLDQLPDSFIVNEFEVVLSETGVASLKAGGVYLTR